MMFLVLFIDKYDHLNHYFCVQLTLKILETKMDTLSAHFWFTGRCLCCIKEIDKYIFFISSRMKSFQYKELYKYIQHTNNEHSTHVII